MGQYQQCQNDNTGHSFRFSLPTPEQEQQKTLFFKPETTKTTNRAWGFPRFSYLNPKMKAIYANYYFFQTQLSIFLFWKEGVKRTRDRLVTTPEVGSQNKSLELAGEREQKDK